jgi:hypothetical protein
MLAGLWQVVAVATSRPIVARKTSTKNKNKHKPVNTKFWEHLPCMGRFPKLANKSNITMVDTHIYKRHDGCQSQIYFQSMSENISNPPHRYVYLIDIAIHIILKLPHKIKVQS